MAQSTIAAITQPSHTWYASREIASQTPKTIVPRAPTTTATLPTRPTGASAIVGPGVSMLRAGDDQDREDHEGAHERERAQHVEREDPVVQSHAARLWDPARTDASVARSPATATMPCVLTMLRVVHLLSATVWVGGTIALVFVGVPAIRQLEGEARATALRTLGRRWRPLGWGAMGVAILSGLWLTEEHGGFDARGARHRLRPHADR